MKKKKKSTALVVRGEQQLPAHIRNSNGEGTEDVKASGIKIPYLSLGGPSSIAVKDGDVEEGDIYNSVSLESFGPEVEIIILYTEEVYKCFDDGRLIGVSKEGLKWENGDLKGTKIDQEELWEYLNKSYYVLIADEAQEGTAKPYILSFKSTAVPNGKKLDNLIIQECKTKGASIYDYPFILTSEEKSKGKRDWIIFDVKRNSRPKKNPWVTPKEQAMAKAARIELLAYFDKVEKYVDNEGDEYEEERPRTTTRKSKSKKSKY